MIRPAITDPTPSPPDIPAEPVRWITAAEYLARMRAEESA